jgi:beta-galactosidase/beta-glucuronidase
VAVTLPASVEKYYWGMLQSRSYVFNSEASEYIWALYGDTQVSNGAYRGVSWFWRYVAVPSFFSGKEVTLHLRSFRQRVEVYVNQKLVGYSLIAETAYDCDISKAIKPGQRNLIAIRITNPGGNYEFIDTSLVWSMGAPYRAVDKEGNTVESYLSRTRDVTAAKAFFE